VSWLIAFGMMVLLDFCWARYVRHVADKSALRSAAWAVVLYALTGGLYISIVHNPYLLIPACAGAFVGTYVSVRYQ
jgi:hypothetical protein